MKRLKVGVIGLGFIGALHTRIYSENPTVELVAVCDVVKDLANAAAQQYGCKPYFDYDAMLAEQELDLVSVCVPEDYHVAPTVAALRAGKAVLIEKPIAKTVAESLEIKRAAEESGARLMVGHVLKFDPRYVSLYEQIKSGALGEISNVYVKRLSTVSSAARFSGRVSFFYYMGIHDIEWMLSYVGSRPTRVYAQANQIINGKVNDQDTAFVTVNFESGALGMLQVGWDLPDTGTTGLISAVEVAGTKGCGFVNTRDQGVEIISADGQAYPDALHWPEYNQSIHGDLKEELASFVDATRDGKPYLVDTDNAIMAVAVAEAAMESIKTGAPVDVKSF